ncbi:hypothetical protein RHOSPDRAFT_26612 [Rhodotorula sp. JG-1b]|nr:hypothetical protein RHOSPDRAFT_26612 [Rhodotorula sp. JG-1b]
MLVPVPLTVTTGNGNRMISVNNLRHEFLLSFFALVKCWHSTDRLDDIELQSRDRSEQAQKTLKRTEDFLRVARLPAYVALLFAEWHCGWLRQSSKVINIKEQDLRACYLEAFESVHKLLEVVWRKYAHLLGPSARPNHGTAPGVDPFTPGARS